MSRREFAERTVLGLVIGAALIAFLIPAWPQGLSVGGLVIAARRRSRDGDGVGGV